MSTEDRNEQKRQFIREASRELVECLSAMDITPDMAPMGSALAFTIVVGPPVARGGEAIGTVYHDRVEIQLYARTLINGQEFVYRFTETKLPGKE